jgi:hypothetical protein
VNPSTTAQRLGEYLEVGHLSQEEYLGIGQLSLLTSGSMD